MINSFGTGSRTDAGGKADGEENGSGSSGIGMEQPESPKARKSESLEARSPEARSPKARKPMASGERSEATHRSRSQQQS